MRRCGELGVFLGGKVPGFVRHVRRGVSLAAFRDMLAPVRPKVRRRVLFSETRAPSWLFGVEDQIDCCATKTGFAVWGAREMLAVIDARMPREIVASLAREFGAPIPAREGFIEVHEPSLIPEIAEADSLLKFVG